MKESEASPSPSTDKLSLVVSFADAEKNLIKVSWKNDSDTHFTLPLPGRITSNRDAVLSWPYFHFSTRQVPANRPTVEFVGYVQLGDETDELTDHLVMNEMPLIENEAPIDRVDWFDLHSRQSVSAVFDLGTLFESVPNQEIVSAKVWFVYYTFEPRSNARANKEYWIGSLKSNVIELSR